MSQSNFNRQFIMIDFRDLDNPRFMEFTRSPEFSTYLTMRRHIWRSLTQHSRGIEQLYAQGYLCCGLSREKIAGCIGKDISKRTVTRDIARLVELEVIQVLGTGYDQVFVLGRWEKKEGVHVEYYYLDRLTPPFDTLETFFQVTADSEADPTRELPPPARSVGARVQSTAAPDGDPGQVCVYPKSSIDKSVQDAGQCPELLDMVDTSVQVTTDSEAKPRHFCPPNLDTSDKNPRQKCPPRIDKRIKNLRIDGGSSLWKAVKEELKLQLTSATFDQWINRTSARRENEVLIITCANDYARDWLTNRMATTIRRTVAGILGQQIEIAFEVKEACAVAGC